MLADHGQLDSHRLLHAQHLIDRRAADLHRLFDDHMPPGTHGLAGPRAVQTAGRADVDDIEPLARSISSMIAIRLHAILVRQPPRPLRPLSATATSRASGTLIAAA